MTVSRIRDRFLPTLLPSLRICRTPRTRTHSEPELYQINFYIRIQITVIINVVLCSGGMSTPSKFSWSSIEQWSTALFLVSGGLFLINAVHEVIARYTGYLEVEFLNFLIYASALVITLLGLLGFYRQLADRSPRLAQVSAVAVLVAGIGLVVLTVWAGITTILEQPMPPGALLLLTLAGVVLAFLLFTAGILRTQTPSRTVSLLLLGFVLAWAVGLVGGFVAFGIDGAPEWFAPSLNGVSAVFLLAIGYVLRTSPETPNRTEPASDTAV